MYSLDGKGLPPGLCPLGWSDGAHAGSQSRPDGHGEGAASLRC